MARAPTTAGAAAASSAARCLLQGGLHLPDQQLLAGWVEGIIHLPVSHDHLVHVLTQILGLGVVQVLKHQVLRDRAVAQVPVVRVVHLPDVVVVLFEGRVPAVLHLLLAVHCRQDPGLVVVPE